MNVIFNEYYIDLMLAIL